MVVSEVQCPIVGTVAIVCKGVPAARYRTSAQAATG
jgi:hypothetical protein